MFRNAPTIAVALALTLAAFSARTEEHSLEALRHAREAAESADSRTIGEHSEEALKHIEAAKKEQAGKIDAHLRHGERDLKAAVRHSNWHNTPSAASDAEEGKTHLEAIRK